MRRLCRTLMMLVFLALAPEAFAQGCAMCLASAMSQSVNAIEAMNLGILVLLIPPFLIIIGILAFAFLRRP